MINVLMKEKTDSWSKDPLKERAAINCKIVSTAMVAAVIRANFRPLSMRVPSISPFVVLATSLIAIGVMSTATVE